MYTEPQVEIAGELRVHESSPGCRRSFCPRCGSQIHFTADEMPGLVDFTIGSLDDPDALPPTLHYWESKRVAWLHVADSLPRYPESPPQPV
jgi:hypothetical protein